jgi:hypothetical protein
MWFHLSTNASLKAIVPSDATGETNVISPRIPDDSYGESQGVNRVCVAPTIWQCILPIPRSGRLFIYEIDTSFVSKPVGGIADSHITDEMWITDDDLEKAGGRIEISRIGFVDKTEQLALSLKIQSRKKKLPVEHAEKRRIWIVDSEQFTLREDWLVR